MDDLKMKPAFFKTTVRSELHHLISYGFLSRCCKQRRTKKNNTKSVVCPAGCLFAGLNLACTRICPNPSSLHLQLFGKLTLTDASDSSPRANGTEFHFGFPPTNTAECIEMTELELSWNWFLAHKKNTLTDSSWVVLTLWGSGAHTLRLPAAKIWSKKKETFRLCALNMNSEIKHENHINCHSYQYDEII